MIQIPSARTYYLYNRATDMRKSFRGLCGLVINELRRDPLQGDGFIFINNRRTMIKVLVWDRTGFVIYYKRLSSGTIELPISRGEANHQRVGVATLLMMLEGVEIKSARMRKRFSFLEKRA
jgi:transposase